MSRETDFKDMNGKVICLGDTVFIEEDEWEGASTGIVLWDEEIYEYLIDIEGDDGKLYLSAYAEFSVIKALTKEGGSK